MKTAALRVAPRSRDFVRASGADAEDYLQRMLSQDVAIDVGESCEALLLTAKARVIAPLVVLRRGHEDFLLSMEPGLGERVLGELSRYRFAAKVSLERESHEPVIVFAAERPDGEGYPVYEFGEPAWELLDGAPAGAVEVAGPDLELMRIKAGTPRVGREIDERILPAEAGLTERAVSFTKGCYPGQEPVARLHYRGHANRGLRVLHLDTDEIPAYDTPLELDGKDVGRVTSAVRDPAGGVAALAYVRREVPAAAELRAGTASARQLD